MPWRWQWNAAEGVGLKTVRNRGQPGQAVVGQVDEFKAAKILGGVLFKLGHAAAHRLGPNGVLLGCVVGVLLLDEIGSGVRKKYRESRRHGRLLETSRLVSARGSRSESDPVFHPGPVLTRRTEKRNVASRRGDPQASALQRFARTAGLLPLFGNEHFHAVTGHSTPVYSILEIG
jgi:hypothetical protein